MRTLAYLIVVLIGFHTACMTQCLAESTHAERASSPPCHEHQQGNPGHNDSQPFATCTEGPTLEAKTSSPVLKCCPSAAMATGTETLTAPSAVVAWHQPATLTQQPGSSRRVPLSARRI